MIIHEFFYNNNRVLYVEFSTNQDNGNFYRVLKLSYEDIEYYSPTIIHEEDLEEITEDEVIELIEQYLLDNNLPEELSL